MDNRRILSASLLSFALAAAPLFSAFAQDAGDPPGRVGRVAEVSGSVSFHTSDANSQWAPASINYPVTGGNAFWTEPRSHAAIDVGASRIYMDSGTELDVANVDDQSFVASLSQGAIYLRVSPAANGDQYEIDTPRGAVHIARPGSYEVIAGDQDHPTTVMAFEGGAAQVVGPGVNAPVNSDQAIYISGQNPPQVNQSAAQSDDFIRFVQAEEQPYQNQNAGGPSPYVSPEMTGYQDLGRYGQWGQDPSYGQVWYPQVAADWAPYRDGHWAYVAPWGWTWVDDAPWGFTPFHYGRWVQTHNRWAWWPGRVEARPVYAPALVTFFGNFGGINLALNVGGGQDVGWIPLAPEEVYVPPYRHSPNYVRNVNITYVRNETTIINVVNNKTVINNYNNFHNRNGATIVNASTISGSRPVAPDFHRFAPNGHIDNKQWADAKPTGFAPPVKPTNETKGVKDYQGKGAPGPNFAGNNQKHFDGKLPPLVTGNGQNGQDKNGQGKSGQGLAGKNSQPQSGQNAFGQNNAGQSNGQNQNGQNQNGQNLKNQAPVVGGGKLPPLPNSQGQNGQPTSGQNNGQNNGQKTLGQNSDGQNNGQDQNGQNQNGQKLKKQTNGQAPVVGGAKLPPLPNGQGQNGQPTFGQNNGQNNGQNQNGQNLKNQTNGQAPVLGDNKLPPLPAVPAKNGQNNFGQNNAGNTNQPQFDQGKNGQGQNNGQAKNIQPQFNQGKNGQVQNNNFTGNGSGPSNQKVNQKPQNGKGIIPPPDDTNGSEHKN